MNNKNLIYSGQTVCVIGLGVTGRAAVRYCRSKGALVTVSDARAEEKFLQDEGEFLKENGIEWQAGGHTAAFLGRSNLLLPSPGIDLRGEPFRSLAESGISIAGELAVVAGQIDVPVVAVTGTNGKTTVTSIIGDVLKSAGKRTFVGGNIGTPLYEYFLGDKQYDVVVVELSSFQLECSGDFAPDVAILLNITPDHLDRHGTMADYILAKARVLSNQKAGDVAIINGDDPLCQNIVIPHNVQCQYFGRFQDGLLHAVEKASSRGNGPKQLFGLARLEETGTKVVARGNGEYVEDFSFSLRCLDGLFLPNYAAAYLALKHLGLSSAAIATGFQRFNHLPHRLEFVAEIDGISFVNDSKATNTGAVLGALGQIKNKVVLIAGGRGKGDNYRLLRNSVEGKVRALVLIGEAAAEIEDSLGDIAVCKRALTMEDAVAKAYGCACTGDTVLLSPACASFDMFSGYGRRGDVYKVAVKELVAQERITQSEKNAK